MKLNGSKENTNILQKGKSEEKNIFTLKIMKNLIKTLKYLLIMAYQLYTWKKSKPCTYRETPTINNMNRFFNNWDSPCARLNSHYKARSYKKKKHKKMKGNKKSPEKEPTVDTCLLTLDFNPFRS